MYCMQYTDLVLGVFLIMCADKHERRSESEICLITVRPQRQPNYVTLELAGKFGLSFVYL